MLGSPGSPAQPVALPHCVCEWERGTPTPPGHPPPTSPLEVRLGEIGGTRPKPHANTFGTNSRSRQTSHASDMTEGRGVLGAGPKGYPDPTRGADLPVR